jgi:hypothetical protein
MRFELSYPQFLWTVLLITMVIKRYAIDLYG